MIEFNRFIKKVIIKNFIRYKDVEISDFDSNINLIIGRNGSGKSSFFKSIEFALTNNIKYNDQLFNKLCNDQNIKEITVTVELSNDYTFTRKLYPKNEHYLINDKQYNQSIYYQLLKYYSMNNNVLIAQGTINQLIGTSDKLRTELIKFTIDQNNIDELKELIQNIRIKFDLVDGLRTHLFADIEARQEDQLMNERRSKIKDEIKLIQLLIEWKEEINPLRKRVKNKKEKYDSIKSELNKLIEEHTSKENQLNQLKQIVEDEDMQNGLFSEENFKELITKKVQLDLEYDDYTKQRNEKEIEKSKLIEQINLVDGEIELKQTKLEEIKPNLEQLKDKERSMARTVQLKKLEIDQLYSHCDDDDADGQNKDEEKVELKKLIDDLQAELSELEKHIDELNSKRDECNQKFDQLTKQQIEINETIEKENQTTNKLKNENLNCETMKRKLCAELDKYKDSLNKCVDKKRNFYPLIGRSILKGKENLEKVIELFKNGTDEEKRLVDNYYGWFIDNISFDKTFAISIDRTARHYLHKHIVNDSKTALGLINKFNEMKFDGTCEFVVLDLLKLKQIPLEKESLVYQPLIKFIGYEKEIERAVKHCFQRIYICRSIEDVISLKKNLTFVTLDGDLLLRKKALNGGFVDKNRIWIEHYTRYRICERLFVETNDKLNELKQNLQNYENNLEQNCIQLNESEQLKTRKQLEKYELRLTLSKNEMELNEFNQLIKNYKQMYKRKFDELENLKSKLELLINRKPMTKQERLNEIGKLEKEYENLTEQFNEIKKNCDQIRLKTKSLKIDLKENLLKRKVDLNESLKNCETNYLLLDSKLSSCEATIKILENSINQMLKKRSGSKSSSQSSTASSTMSTDKIFEKQLDLVDKKKQICALEHAIQQLTAKEIELKLNLENNLQIQRTYEDKINQYETQMEELAEKANRYTKYDSKALNSKLKELQSELNEIGSQPTSIVSDDLNEQRYNHIYNTLTVHRDLMTYAIDLFKSEVTIDRTLQTLSLFFTRFQQIFSMFKSNGKIEYQINLPEQSIVNQKISDKISLRDIWSQMNVSFNGETPRRIEFCSGGQKTTLSLCYLLSILTLKQYPFLMIDETDQALDEATCLKLGAILKENFSNTVQFFFSSNRTYFSAFADKIFKVSMDRNQSTLIQIEIDQLGDFVSSQEASEGSVHSNRSFDHQSSPKRLKPT